MPPNTKDPGVKKKSVRKPRATKPTASVKEPYSAEPTFVNVRGVDINSNNTSESVVVASGKHSDVQQLINKLEGMDSKTIDKDLSPEQLITIGINFDSVGGTKDRDIGYQLINSEEFVNVVNYKNKHIGIDTIPVKATGTLTGENAVAKFTSSLGIGKHTMVTLWHSGFSLMLSPPKDSDVINLQYNIAKLEQSLGQDTNNFIYSNYGVVINRILTDFILKHVISSSLTLPEGGSYLDYIKLTDLDTLAMGMANSMRPGGYPIIATCKNSLVFDKDVPLCDFTASADIPPERLLWVNRSALTTENLAHISKTTPGSHTVEDVLGYQESLLANGISTISVKRDDRSVVTFNIQTPSLREHISVGELWVNTVIKDAQDLFLEDDAAEVKEEKIDTMVLASMLNKYNSYIKSIGIDDAVVEDSGTISSILTVLTGDGKLSNDLIKKILTHIDDNYIALVATYNFDCPTCKEAGRDPDQTAGYIKGFKEFIPLNAVMHFFDLSTLRYTEVINRNK